MDRLPRVELDHVAIALDGSESSWGAFQLALAIHPRPPSRITALSVVPLSPAFEKHPAEAHALLERLRQDADEFLAQARQKAGSRALEANRLEGRPADEICRWLDRHRPSLAVVGSHGLSQRKAHRLGGVGEAIAQESAVPVLIAKDERPLRKVLVAVDGSPGARRAAMWAGGLARDIGAAVLLCYVVPEGVEDVRFTVTRNIAEPFLGPLGAAIREDGVQVSHKVRYGHPAQEILSEAKGSGCDTVVVGRWGHVAPKGFVMGGVADHVLHASHCNVLVVP